MEYTNKVFNIPTVAMPSSKTQIYNHCKYVNSTQINIHHHI